MKYMQEGGFQSNPLMRLTLALTLVLLVGFWATNVGMYFSRMSLEPASVVAYYNGSEEDFRPARSAASMVETSHAHLAMMALVLLLLTHLALFVPLPRWVKGALVVTAFASAALGEAAGWLVRFVDPAFAPLKVAAFLGLQGTLAVLIVSLGVFLIAAHRRGGEVNGVRLPPGFVRDGLSTATPPDARTTASAERPPATPAR